MRYAALLLLVGSLALVFGPGDALTQIPGVGPGGGPGGFRGGRGNRGGGGGGQMRDPGMMFDRLAGGKSEIVIAELPNPGMQQWLGRVAQSQGITTGVITREQFMKGSEAMRAQMMGGAAPAATAVPGAAPGPAGTAQQGGPAAPGAVILKDPLPEVEEKKPIVYRSGHMPKGFEWFERLDTDKDGQIGLYEWIAANKNIDEFLAADRNEDGFLTIQEAQWAIKKKILNVAMPRGFGPPAPAATTPAGPVTPGSTPPISLGNGATAAPATTGQGNPGPRTFGRNRTGMNGRGGSRGGDGTQGRANRPPRGGRSRGGNGGNKNAQDTGP